MAEPSGALRRFLPEAGAMLSNGLARARNLVVEALPGERPEWLVLDLKGSFPARRARRKLLSLATVTGAEKEQSLEEFAEQVDSLLRAPWLKGVVLRFTQLEVDLATAYALRNQVALLQAGGKRVVASVTELGNTSYYLASAADEIIAPESATVMVHGMALTATFVADAIGRFGVRFEKLAIDEFKNAGDNLVRSSMSDAQRHQYGAYLDSASSSYLADVAARRSRSENEVKGWIDSGVTSSEGARALGMIDRVAYDDEYMSSRHKPYAAGANFLPSPVRSSPTGRVAVVSLVGNIVPGKSRRTPVPVPIFGDRMAGSETLVSALRTAAQDRSTKAVVFHVESGGGSALASDLIGREVKLLAREKPVVAVMGQVAGSGGYYVLTHATRVMAAPFTITGSIGVVMLKPVLEEFNRRYGFNPETLERGRFASLLSPARSWNEEEAELLRRQAREIYEMFVSRVAEGRGLSRERVDEIGRGRIWSGRDALGIGLVDELGDVQLGIARAKELAGLPVDAPVWNVHTSAKLLLPKATEPEVLARELWPLLREGALLLDPALPSLR